MTLLGLRAQECSSLWITCPQAQNGQQVAYASECVAADSIAHAQVVVASTGYFRLYVNGSLVTVPPYPLARAPFRDGATDGMAVATRFDITRHLQKGRNVVVMHCSPLDDTTATAFSLRLSGVYADGREFLRDADDSWMCCPLGASFIGSKTEFQDGRESIASLTLDTDGCVMRWLPAATDLRNIPVSGGMSVDTNYEYISKVIKPRFFSVAGDEKSVSFDFGAGFYGMLRVTIRNTKPGQRLFIDGSEYVCKGKDDEQFVMRFASSWFRKIYISGDEKFTTKQVSKVEGLQILPIIAK